MIINEVKLKELLVNAFIDKLKEYMDYYNNERISLKLKMSSVQYRTQSQII